MAALYPPSAFVWQRGVTPLSDPRLLGTVPCAYVATVLLLRALLRGRALPLGPLPVLHNAVLALGSAAMFGGTAWEALVAARAAGSSRWLFCTPPGTPVAGALWWWSYVYYVSKYYELLDTVLRVLKGQPLTFLHVFHHAVVLLMAYGWLEFAQSLQVIGLLANTGIHVVMYTYYLLSSLGLKPGKGVKMLVTNGQIVQFLFRRAQQPASRNLADLANSFVCSVPFLELHFAHGGCSGFEAWCFNVVFNLILVLLFAQFHRRTYAEGRGRKKAA